MGKNRYERKRQHIRELKKRHAKLFGSFDPQVDENISRERYLEEQECFYLRHLSDPRNEGYQYWDTFYLSGPRKLAKQCTNRKIRSGYKDLLAHEEPEDIVAYHGADYQKEFDYVWWALW